MAKPTAQTRYAKQLFLYGNGDGKRITNVPALAKQAGVTENTIRVHIPEWEKESESILINSNTSALALSLSKEQLDQNNKDLSFIRDQINQLKFELSSIEKITARLGEWLDKFDGDELQTALDIFNDYVRGCGQKSALRSQFIAMKKLWDEKSAIDGLRDVALTREKEVSKGKAKLEIKKLEGEQGTLVPRVVSGVFARPDRIGSVDV